MSSTTFFKDTAFCPKMTGCNAVLRILLLGILLPSVLVPGATTASAQTTTGAGSTGTTQPSGTTGANPSASMTTSTGYSQSLMSTAGMNGTLPMSMLYCPSFVCNYSDCYSMYTSQNATSCSGFCQLIRQMDSCYNVSCSTSCAVSCSNASQIGCSVSCCNSTGCLNDSFASMMMTTTGTTQPTMSGSTNPPPSIGTSSGYSQLPMSTAGMTGNTMTNPYPMSMIYCPSFVCNYSDCYAMYTSQNATSCTGFCQLTRQMDIIYNVSCSASCAVSCSNASQIGCSVNCCNSTGCLNGSFASMMMTTTTVITTTATPPTTKTTTTSVASTAAPNPQTTANNGNKCHQGKCTGATCYKEFSAIQICPITLPHCQLKKETVDSAVQWTAGCTTNCSAQPVCKDSVTPPCHLECCNATTTSCLMLNGTLNVPSFATRGPHLNTGLIASLLCLFAITLLL